MFHAGRGNGKYGAWGNEKMDSCFAGMTGEMSGMFHAGRGVRE